jgi:hypothetical protein
MYYYLTLIAYFFFIEIENLRPDSGHLKRKEKVDITEYKYVLLMNLFLPTNLYTLSVHDICYS